jgi:hypothetical protein
MRDVIYRNSYASLSSLVYVTSALQRALMSLNSSIFSTLIPIILISRASLIATSILNFSYYSLVLS